MKKWEYLAVYYGVNVDVSLIDEFGNQGWELIAIMPLDSSLKNTRWIFKREKIDKVNPVEGD